MLTHLHLYRRDTVTVFQQAEVLEVLQVRHPMLTRHVTSAQGLLNEIQRAARASCTVSVDFLNKFHHQKTLFLQQKRAKALFGFVARMPWVT